MADDNDTYGSSLNDYGCGCCKEASPTQATVLVRDWMLRRPQCADLVTDIRLNETSIQISSQLCLVYVRAQF